MRVKIDVIGEKNRLSKSGELPLTIRLTQNKRRRYIRVGIGIKPEYWDEIRNKVKSNCPNMGGISEATVDVRLILQAALLANASSLVCVHNHPSGNVKPSFADDIITIKIQKACKAGY